MAGSKTIYIDPGPLKEAATLPKADIILATHGHTDHLRSPTVERLFVPGTVKAGPARCQAKLGPGAMVIAPGDKLELGGVLIEVVHAYNPSRRWRMTFHKKGTGVGYVLTIDRTRIYHAGDTGLIDEMMMLGPIDVALIPIGGTFTMNVDQAVEAVKIIKPRVVIPMHMLRADPLKFKDRVEKETSAKVTVLAPGETATFS